MHLPSGSKVGLAEICPGSHCLPWTEQKKSPAAVKGDRIHRYLEYRLEGDPIDWVAMDIPPHLRKVCNAIDMETITRDLISPRSEAAMVWDLATSSARVIGYRIGRNYDKHGRKHGEIAGSADVVAFHGTLGHPVVIDYKTGRHIGPVSDSWQMRFLALMTAHATGWSCCEARVVYIGWHGEVTTESHMFDALALDSDTVSIGQIIDRIREAEKLVQLGEHTSFSAGDHCDRMYCPARENCLVYKSKVAA